LQPGWPARLSKWFDYRRISVAKQDNGTIFNGSDSISKDTKPKGFPT